MHANDPIIIVMVEKTSMYLHQKPNYSLFNPIKTRQHHWNTYKPTHQYKNSFKNLKSNQVIFIFLDLNLFSRQ
jgi:hypothetical protein